MAKNRKDDSSNYDTQYRDMLDDVYGTVDVCWLKYLASDLLFEVDPTAYRCWLNDFADSMDDEWVCEKCGRTFDSEEKADECARTD